MRPSRYYDQDFMAQRWSYLRGSTVQEERNRADPHTKSDVKKTTNENRGINVASP